MKKKQFKKQKITQKNNRGITLIALVITIIVLLILAGISISMLSGDNSIMNQATNAKTKTIHSSVFEQMQLKASEYKLEKTTGGYDDNLINYLKSKSVISDISGEEEKWLINVTVLLGSNQSIGKGTYPSDVYVLEKQSTSTGNIKTSRIASTMQIRIAATTHVSNYIVKYYGDNSNKNTNLGVITDSNNGGDIATTDLAKLQEIYLKFFNNEELENEEIDILSKTEGVEPPDPQNYFFAYNNKLYSLNNNSHEVSYVDIDYNTFGVYEVGGGNILITPSTPDHLIHVNYRIGTYSIKIEDEEDEDGYRNFNGYKAMDNDKTRFYNDSGDIMQDAYEQL